MGGRGALIRLAYVHSFTDSIGKQRYYFRRNGKRTPLPGLPGSREFMDAYAAALASQPPPASRRAEAAPGTMAALAIRYYGSPKYRNLSESSRRNYRRVIDGFLETYGACRVDQLKRGWVDKIIGGMSDKPGAAIVLLKRIRTLVHYAIDLEWINHDPTLRATSYQSREFHTWTEDEILTFERRWPIGTAQRLGFALLLYTGQRGSDVCRMAWPGEDGFRVVQKKTGERLLIPIHPNLAEVLAAAKRDHVAALVTAYGVPFSVKGFGQMMSAAIRAAGLSTRCKAHGLRKAAARRLAEAGATEKQIGAVTGHRTLAEIERYTRAANQERLARDAMEKQVANRQ